MRLRRFVHSCAASAALSLVLGTAVPVFAQEAPQPGSTPASSDTRPEWRGGQPVIDPRIRNDWLAECRRRVSAYDNGLGGAVIGGLVGAVAGNRIAGHGNRTVGTVAGAAVGAAAGMAIDKAEDNGRVRDQCETFLDDYYAHAGYGADCCNGAPMVMVPVIIQPRRKPECMEAAE